MAVSQARRRAQSLGFAVALAVFCAGCSRSRKNETTRQAPPAITIKTVMDDYYTAASARLRHLEVDFNTDLPASTYQGPSGQGTSSPGTSPQANPPLPPILYLDYDQISTWYAMPQGPDSLEEAIGDYLMVRTGHPVSDTTETILAQAMNSLDAEGVVRQRNGSGNCLVVPEYPGISFDSFYAASLSSASGRDGPDLLAGKTVTIGLPTRAFQDFVDAHESWHCLDIRYIRDTGDGLEGAVKQNRTEMFADIGGAMEGLRDGADLTLIDKVAELRASWSLLTGPVHARNEDNNQHFDGVVYATEGGLDALKMRIQQMGIDSFRKLNREQMRAIAYELTDAHCLTYEQAEALEAYYSRGATGAPPAAAAPVIARMRALTAASVRQATPAEEAAQANVAKEAAANGGWTEESVLDQLRTRARQLGSATSLADQLKARQELTDSLRQKLLNDPATEQVTEAQLKLLLYTDPTLAPRPANPTGPPGK